MWESACFQLSRPTQYEGQVHTLIPSLRALQMKSRDKNQGCAGVCQLQSAGTPLGTAGGWLVYSGTVKPQRQGTHSRDCNKH